MGCIAATSLSSGCHASWLTCLASPQTTNGATGRSRTPLRESQLCVTHRVAADERQSGMGIARRRGVGQVSAHVLHRTRRPAVRHAAGHAARGAAHDRWRWRRHAAVRWVRGVQHSRHLDALCDRQGPECWVPLHIWRTRSFQSWYADLRAAENRLVEARVRHALFVQRSVFLWTLWVDVFIAAEGACRRAPLEALSLTACTTQGATSATSS